jgi:hypothetical protein
VYFAGGGLLVHVDHQGIATGADKTQPGVTGNAAGRSLGDKLTGWYSTGSSSVPA